MSAHLAASLFDSTLKPAPSAFLAVAEPGAQGDGDFLDAAVAQVLRVGVALAAVAEHGDLLVGDQIEVGNRRRNRPSCLVLRRPAGKRPGSLSISRRPFKGQRPRIKSGATRVKYSGLQRPAHHADDAGAADLDQAELAHQRDEAVDLVRRAGQLEDEAARSWCRPPWRGTRRPGAAPRPACRPCRRP